MKRLTVEVRARQGAAFMDKARPGWHEEVWSVLEMNDCHRCILGQIYGVYQRGCETLGFEAEAMVVYKYGFNLPDSITNKDNAFAQWRRLGEAWQKEIRDRKEVSSMNIGDEDEAIVVEPAEDPFAPVEMDDIPPSKIEEQEKEKELIPA